MLNWIRSRYDNIQSKFKPDNFGEISCGLYHFERTSPGERSRIHLRVDWDGTGLLIVNANRIMHLNPTAVFMAYSVLNEITEKYLRNP